MKSSKTFLKFFLGLSLTLGGCSSRIDHHGKLPEPEKLQQLKKGIHTQEDVLRLIGSPTSISTFDPKVWLYVHRTTETKSFLTPKVLEQKQVIVTFDTRGVLKEVVSQENEKDIPLSGNKTPTSGFEPSWSQQIFGHYGRFAKKGKAD